MSKMKVGYLLFSLSLLAGCSSELPLPVTPSAGISSPIESPYSATTHMTSRKIPTSVTQNTIRDVSEVCPQSNPITQEEIECLKKYGKDINTNGEKLHHGVGITLKPK